MERHAQELAAIRLRLVRTPQDVLTIRFVFPPTAESFGVSAQVGSGVVQGSPEVRFHEVPRGSAEEHRMLLGISPEHFFPFFCFFFFVFAILCRSGPLAPHGVGPHARASRPGWLRGGPSGGSLRWPLGNRHWATKRLGLWVF